MNQPKIKQIFRCPKCNAVLGESIDGIFIRTRAGEMKIWGNNLHILLTCHNDKPGDCYEAHPRMILIKQSDDIFEFLPYEKYFEKRLEGKLTN